MKKLKLAYFANSTSVGAIIDANTALMPDVVSWDATLKSIVLQANSNECNANKHNQRNTFLFR